MANKRATHRIIQGIAILLLPLLFFLLSMLSVLICFLAVLFFFASFAKIKTIGILQWLITLFQATIFLIAGIGISAPFRALTILIWRITGYPMEQIRDFSVSGLQFLRSYWPDLPSDTLLGWAGATTFFILGLSAFIVLEKQSRQFKNLPTSDVSSVSIGLAELKGRAKFSELPRFQAEVDSTGGDIPSSHILYYRKYQDGDREREIKRWSTFYLEDKTGRILVDPRGVEFWDGHWGFSESLSKIWLKRRHEQTISLQGTSETRSLQEGDPVMVIGSVEVDHTALPDAKGDGLLVVRPSTEQRRRGLLERLFHFGDFMKLFGRGREYRHIFVLADAGESDIVNALNRGKLGVLGWSGIGIGLSLLLAVGKL